MKSNQRRAVWPYLIVLAGLFALSVSAPRAWNRMRYAGPTMERLVTEDGGTRKTEGGAGDESASRAPHENVDQSPTLPAEVAPPPSVYRLPPTSTDWATAATQAAPVLVKPLREFGRQVIDPIVEFASRPTELRTTPDMSSAPFETTDQAGLAEAKVLWAMPQILLDGLDRLATSEDASEWAARVTTLLRHLQEGDVKPEQALRELRALIEPAAMPAPRSESSRIELDRMRYAIHRRLAIWEPIAALEHAHDTAIADVADPRPATNERLAKCLGDIERLTASLDTGAAWREFLLVEQLKSSQQTGANEKDTQRELARKVLARLELSQRSKPTRQFVAKPAIAALETELHALAAEPVDSWRLLERLERFELTQLPSDGKQLAQDCATLRYVSDPQLLELGEHIDLHYRNANVRLSLGQPFINRFVPQPSATLARVHDTIAGVPVNGRSTTFTKIAVRMIPDEHRIRIGLEASGVVNSSTTSDAGPATFYNRAASSFTARKLLLFGPSGLRVWPSISDAESYYQNLQDMETSFDGVPLIGTLMRNYARTQHDETAAASRHEVESKVAARARQQFDSEVQPRLERLTKRLDGEMLEPLRLLGLDPTVLDMSTTEDRITMRMRFAGEDQLAAYTPRPRAPADSVASLQVHHSALNNLLESLDLNGREFSAPELYRWLGKKVNDPTMKQPEDLPDDVRVQFAEQDAIRVQCKQGRVEFTLSLAKLSHGRKTWRNFQVKTTYHPDVHALDGRFVRASGIFLEGKSLQGRAEFVLRSILSKALSVDRPWRLIPERLATDPRMADLEIAQMVIEDGWIGMAYAPRRVSSATARKPSKH